MAYKSIRDNERKEIETLFRSNPFSSQEFDARGVLQRPRMSIEAKAPKGTPSIHEFIRYLEEEEARYDERERTNIPLMISIFRKVFYDSTGWDKYLIRGARDVRPGYERVEVEKCKCEFSTPYFFKFAVWRRRNVPWDDDRSIVPPLYKLQEIALADGTYIDMGHVLAGLDAWQHRQQVVFSVGGKIQTELALRSNVDAVTWLGDLGSVLAETQFRFVSRGKYVTNEEIRRIISEYASPQDMVGNLDVYALARKYNLGSSELSAQGTLSDILREYYLDGFGDMKRSSRYVSFAEEVGLLNGSKIMVKSKWVRSYNDQLSDAAAMYIGSNCVRSIVSTILAIGMSTNEHAATELLGVFYDSIVPQLKESMVSVDSSQ